MAMIVVAWCTLQFLPGRTNLTSGENDVTYGWDWGVEHQREYGFPFKCVVTRPAANSFQPFWGLWNSWEIHKVLIFELIGNVFSAVALVFAILWFIRN